MLVGAVMVKHVRRVVENITANQRHYREAKDQAQAEPEQDASDDQTESDETTDAQDWPHPGEVFPRDKNRRRKAAENSERKDSCCADDVLPGESMIGDVQQRKEDNGFRDDVKTQSQVLHGR